MGINVGGTTYNSTAFTPTSGLLTLNRHHNHGLMLEERQVVGNMLQILVE
jgi:hypothetical protein